MENKNPNRRNFLELVSGMTLLPSLVLSEERKFNPKSKGWAIQYLSSKQKVRGFIGIPTVWGEQLTVPEIAEPFPFFWDQNYRSPIRANIGLVESINKYTDINAYSDAHLYISSNHLIEYPFLYIATDKAFELTKTERDNFENYLRNGGFAVLESLEPELDYSQSEASLKQMVKDTLKKDARFLPISKEHKLYHCFFDFNDGPPISTEIKMFMTKTTLSYDDRGQNSRMSKPRYYLEGVFLDDRLAVIYSGKGYGRKWKDIANNEPQQKMGVNFVVYALTQKGGIAQKNKY